MATATEMYKIAQNVLARTGFDGDLQGEVAKAMSGINRLDTYNELNPPPPPTVDDTAIISDETGENIPAEESPTIVP